MACASCHFHAGADFRTKNQIAPEGKNALIHSPIFENGPNGVPRGPNATLSPNHFPFFQTADPLDPLSVYAPTYVSNDVVGSGGSFRALLASLLTSESFLYRTQPQNEEAERTPGPGARGRPLRPPANPAARGRPRRCRSPCPSSSTA